MAKRQGEGVKKNKQIYQDSYINLGFMKHQNTNTLRW